MTKAGQHCLNIASTIPIRCDGESFTWTEKMRVWTVGHQTSGVNLLLYVVNCLTQNELTTAPDSIKWRTNGRDGTAHTASAIVNRVFVVVSGISLILQSVFEIVNSILLIFQCPLFKNDDYRNPITSYSWTSLALSTRWILTLIGLYQFATQNLNRYAICLPCFSSRSERSEMRQHRMITIRVN